MENKPKFVIPKLAKQVAVAATILIIGYLGWQRDNQDIQKEKERVAVVEQQHQAALHEEEVVRQRKIAADNYIKEQTAIDINNRVNGYTYIVKFNNVFGEFISNAHIVNGKNKNSFMYIESSGDDIKDVCFSSRDYENEKTNLWISLIPLFPDNVSVKFDNGKTETFRVSTGAKTDSSLEKNQKYVCIFNDQSKFANRIKNSSNLKIELPVDVNGTKATRIYEFNLTSYNRMTK